MTQAPIVVDDHRRAHPEDAAALYDLLTEAAEKCPPITMRTETFVAR